MQNFESFISFATGYGTAYAPTNADLAVAALNAKLAAEAEGGGGRKCKK